MRRVVVATILVAGAALVGFGAPARGVTNHAATMVGTTTMNFRYAEGTCNTVTGDKELAIQTGDTVTWTNCTQVAHTVTGDEGSFGNADQIAPQSSVTHTFLTPGEFEYHCELHSSMTGKVTVTGSPVAPTTTVTTPSTTQTTVRQTTTRPTTTTTIPPTTTTDNLGEVFDPDSTPSTTETTVFSTGTTRALGSGGDDDTSAGLVALLIVGLGAVGTAGALLIRRIRMGGDGPV